MFTITRAQDAIGAMVRDGRGFGEIGDFISEQPVYEELKCVSLLVLNASHREGSHDSENSAR